MDNQMQVTVIGVADREGIQSCGRSLGADQTITVVDRTVTRAGQRASLNRPVREAANMEQASSGQMTGRTALITGGSGGIGKATAMGLARLGAHLAITGRDRG